MKKVYKIFISSLLLGISFGFIFKEKSFVNSFYTKEKSQPTSKPSKIAAVNITAPTLNNVCINAGYRTLSNIVITENAVGDFPNGTNNTLVLKMPSDFELEANQGNIAYQNGRDITAANILSVSVDKVVIIYTVGGTTQSDVLTISGLKVRAKVNPAPNNQMIVETAAPAIAGITTGTTTVATFTISNLGKPAQIGSTLSFCANNLASAQIRFNSANADKLKWYRAPGLKQSIIAATQNNNTPINITTLLGNNPAVGTHTVYVTGKKDGGGEVCESEETAVAIEITPNPVIALAKNVSDVTCVGKSVTFTAVGPDGNYKFEITGGTSNPSLQDSNSKTYTRTFGQAGNYTITVTYTSSGCSSISAAVGLNVLPEPDVKFIDPETGNVRTSIVLNRNVPSYRLRIFVDKPGGTFFIPDITITDGDKVETKDFTENDPYSLTYTYTDPITGCSKSFNTQISINDVPIFLFKVPVIDNDINACIYDSPRGPLLVQLSPSLGQSILERYRIGTINSIESSDLASFDVNTKTFYPDRLMIPEGQSFLEVNFQFRFQVDENLNFGTSNPPNYQPISGGFQFFYSTKIRVYKRPTGTIQVISGLCSGSGNPKFKAITDYPTPSFTWDFGDGSTQTTNTPVVTKSAPYSEAKEYVVTLTISSSGCESEPIVQNIRIFPYYQNITATDPLYIKNEECQEQGLRNTWALGIPDPNRNIKANKSIWSTMIYATQNQDAIPSTSYSNSQKSYVECPCINLNQLNRPVLSMSIWSDSDIGSDGAVLQVTYNDGESWSTVGNIDEGINWYNRKDILGLPVEGNTGPRGTRQGWSGRDQGWRIARFPLDEIKSTASNKPIRFRVFFGSNADNPPDKYDGFAFDSVRIESRNRQSIVEYFTNTISVDSLNNENYFIKTFPDPQDELTNIQYHTNFVDGVENILYKDNPADPSARALFYGISKAPRAAIDGSTKPESRFSLWGPAEFRKKTLIPSPFKIDINFINNPSDKLNIQTTVTAIQALSRPIIIHTVVIEKNIAKDKIDTDSAFINVVKKMLPDAAGTFYNQPWTAGSSQIFNQSLTLYDLTQSNVLNPVIYDPNQLAVVVFIQDDETKEIYQSSVITTPSVAPPLVSGIEDPILKRLKMFPNPTQRELNFDFGQIMGEEYQWEIYNHWGVKLIAGKFAENNKLTTCKVDDLAKGMYVVKIVNRKNKANVVKKLIIN
ncbi:MAG: T9SS type A sorting domain-containing protein [Microscillaceae bacterium]|jgi:hypothetical protein|nr:T9SS type A sorting domain-containing protein [Microscillaceae bacterium]